MPLWWKCWLSRDKGMIFPDHEVSWLLCWTKFLVYYPILWQFARRKADEPRSFTSRVEHLTKHSTEIKQRRMPILNKEVESNVEALKHICSTQFHKQDLNCSLISADKVTFMSLDCEGKDGRKGVELIL